MPQGDRTAAVATAPAVKASNRRGYLDWLRGIAVLIMIEAHLVDSWTGVPDRNTKLFAWSMVLGGFGAPLFLLLAGVAASLSAGSKARRGGEQWAAAVAVMRRGLEVFGLAFLFRLQAWILGWSSYKMLLRVDILNLMGLAIIAAAVLWGLGSGPRRMGLFLLATLATSLLTPLVRSASWLADLPNPLEAYIRPAGPYSAFPFFPWAGFVFAGGLIGVLLDGRTSMTPRSEARLNTWFGVGGAILALAAFGASFLPTPYRRSDFWTSSPSFFLLRLGLLTLSIGLAYAWERRPWSHGWSWVQQLGRSSLFIYWVHVELVYGLVSIPLHHKLAFWQSCIALVLFSALMLYLSLAKDRYVAARQAAPEPLAGTSPAALT